MDYTQGTVMSCTPKDLLLVKIIWHHDDDVPERRLVSKAWD